MQKLIPLALLSCLFIACNGSNESTESSENSSDTTNVDTLTAADTIQINVDSNRPKVDVDALFAKADEEYKLPFKVDSSFISSFMGEAEDEYDLTGAEAKYLAYDMVDNEATNMASWDIKTFIRLDSIKTQGDWEAYQNSLDLGQARYSNGNVVGVVKIDDVSSFLLWTTDYATYEACPYGSGTYVYGTLFTLMHGTNTVLLGEMSGGGDPPSWGDTRVYSEIKSDKIITESLQRTGEEDYDGNDFVDKRESKYEISISTQGLNVEVSEIGEWSGDNY